MTGPLPPVDAALLPSAVREGGEKSREAYRAALGFERVMLGELLKQVDVVAESEDAPPAYRDLLPQSLADSLVAGGGIGLAGHLYESIREAGE